MQRILLSMLIFFACLASAHAVVLDRVVALVNDDVITLSELKSLEISVLKSTVEKPGKEESTVDRDSLLDDMIDKKIKLQKAEEINIKVSDEEVRSAIQQILSRNKITEEALKEKLHTEGFTWDEYTKEIREQMILSSLVNQEVRSKIFIMPGDIEKYYQEHMDEFSMGEKKHLLSIFLSVPEKAGEDEIQARNRLADELRQRALSGEPFRDIAVQYSDGREAKEGGDLGYLSQDDLRSEMSTAVAAMKPGDVSPVIRIGEGFVLLKVEDVHADSHTSFEEVKDKIQDELYQEKLKQRYDAWLKELKSKAFIDKKPAPPEDQTGE
ncbi:MAG: peptidyl-prolyl cis-trans isomerase [bacterium]